MATISFLLLFLISTSLEFKAESSSSRGPYHPAECCFHYITHAIPHQRVTRYYETTSECSRPGVIFITKRNQPICANPENEWVQDLIKELGEN
ncbi:C-C motif chemokine 14-like isoform X1 [Perognathus longimembris pacificus]|uniref:C-C motif chemokine 14-like isoform X1 n=1 Tax=Perognathus longimembris pacificus TaxID=214514 RepID=UPI0020186597|nr:C-C motif chemokine 14-like isoform X1 [Perognathus longimembris pacificus]